MKTHINQIFTVVGFFSLSIGATLAISWSMTSWLYHDEMVEAQRPHSMTVQKVSKKLNIDLSKSFKLLIPKTIK